MKLERGRSSVVCVCLCLCTNLRAKAIIPDIWCPWNDCLFVPFFFVSIILSSNICVFIWWNRSKYVMRESAKKRVESIVPYFRNENIFGWTDEERAWEWWRGRNSEKKKTIPNSVPNFSLWYAHCFDRHTLRAIMKPQKLRATTFETHFFFSPLVLCQSIIFYANV